ncbi:single-stranded-DNA-specific exonuclease RecJ [Mesorhizobium sp. M3A.F.Ca.ET.174.01.1.1]|uniref:single-stranded-DNA-specific exonuclease RecJ n=1 Tax=unclassified Mesorhizobium TaxID=325217 RepID=UPI001093B6FB|nr:MULTISPECIES: single-stranded-DNA-specific exonuclease RecJ [unclassified Mesorhizobium]TGS88809.1 single-stranded-DNA-specific exonuclease RecJ [Mesorhizobium sp. M3A.F.Ca.ET.175.01.1.1]TGT30582.1 single-stranded-DNA-specific exonuclease RecJ [Mesorhizobium sp. M3A.F.Ca.ET.174.01.1.1]
MTGERRFFLDVRQSANGVCWEHRLTERQDMTALAIAQGFGVPDIVARVLAGRNVAVEQTERFLDPTIRELLPNPASLTDMEKAAARLADAIVAHEKVAIFGDYDVDGAASSALLKRFLTHFSVPSEIYIPDRIFEGYGPNPEAIRELISRGAKLIVTVDCGTNSAASIDAAKQAGADVVVLDHHQVGGPLPAADAVVNPNREDDLSGQGHLCAAGVVFLCLVQTAKVLRERLPDRTPPDLLSLLDLAALATVCDVVPLTGVNRAFVVKGLQVARQQKSEGLAALARVSRIGEPINTFHLAYLIGPRINAGGRIGDAALGSRLLATDDPVEAASIAETLDRLNQERQQMELEMLAEARAEADAELAGGSGPAIVVTASNSWHPGIVGLLASRLKEHSRRPAFAVAFNSTGVGTGSGRSVSGFDLGRLVRAAAEAGLIVKGGGHGMAAGITVERAKLGALRGFFEEHAAADVFRLQNEESLAIDGALAAEGATLDLIDELERAGPFGAGHAAPVFALPRHRLADARPVGTNHIRAELISQSGGRIQAMAFRAVDTLLGEFLFRNRGKTVHVAGSLSANHWNGNRTVQFRITDAVLA